MIKTTFGHIVFHIDAINTPFYKDLFSFLGWAVWLDEPGMLGLGADNGASVWFGDRLKKEVNNDYDGIGMNHFAISANSQADVDAVVDYLKEKNVPALFETPRHRPEFCSSPENTYYQVMFESPDRVLFEVVYMGPKA
jgi:catechol 2,3-dioxygenase-like lactoylglutathione lyase family enzyme